MRLYGVIFSFTLFFGLTSYGAFAPNSLFDQAVQRYIVKDYPVYKNYGKYLLKHYPPSKSIYLAIGSSPVTVIAFLQEYQKYNPEILALNIPVSGYGDFDGISRFSENVLRVLKEFLPAALLESGRDIIVLDQTGSGKSLVLGGLMIKHFLEKNELRNKITLFGMGRSLFFKEPFYQAYRDAFGAEELILPESAVVAPGMGINTFRERRRYVPVQKEPGLFPEKESRPHYLFLREMVRGLIERDPDLQNEFDDSVLSLPGVERYAPENCKTLLQNFSGPTLSNETSF